MNQVSCVLDPPLMRSGNLTRSTLLSTTLASIAFRFDRVGHCSAGLVWSPPRTASKKLDSAHSQLDTTPLFCFFCFLYILIWLCLWFLCKSVPSFGKAYQQTPSTATQSHCIHFPTWCTRRALLSLTFTTLYLVAEYPHRLLAGCSFGIDLS